MNAISKKNFWKKKKECMLQPKILTYRKKGAKEPYPQHGEDCTENFALDKRQTGLEELKDVLYQHYSKRMEERLDALWESGTLDQKRLDEINGMDLHQLK